MNILAFFAHPDDETMLCGGTLAALAARGHAVHILLATRGEGGELGDPPLSERAMLGVTREAEGRCAAAALGAASIEYLPYVDPAIGPDDLLFAFDAALPVLVTQLQDAIREYHCEVVLGHGTNGEYGHPAHLLAHQGILEAVSTFSEWPVSLYTVQAAYPAHPKPRVMNVDDAAHLVLDITPHLEAKLNAALCHRTQHALFIRRPSAAAGRAMSVDEIINITESLHRRLPAYRPGETDPIFTELNALATAAV